MQTVTLLASELVSNAVRHAKAESVALHCHANRARVRLEVADEGPGFSGGALPPDPLREGGWGLYIVNGLATRWGTIDGPGSRVWFEIDR